MNELPQRKRIRLPDNDYSSPGAYFVTICTYQKKCFLSQIVVGAIHESPEAFVRLTSAGRAVQQAIDALAARSGKIQVDNCVIMPNHVHLLLRIREERAIHESPLQYDGKRSLLDKAIGYLKMNSSRKIHVSQPELPVWQRSYYDHVIRNERDFFEIWNYINNNPARWAEDRFFVDE